MKNISFTYAIIRNGLVSMYCSYLRIVWGLKIGRNTRISLKANIDKSWPESICIGKNTYISAGCTIIGHDFINGERKTVTIGDNCFIGVNAIILPGVSIGDGCIIAAGSVVNNNIDSGSLVAGVPGKVIKKVNTYKWGKLYEK